MRLWRVACGLVCRRMPSALSLQPNGGAYLWLAVQMLSRRMTYPKCATRIAFCPLLWGGELLQLYLLPRDAISILTRPNVHSFMAILVSLGVSRDPYTLQFGRLVGELSELYIYMPRNTNHHAIGKVQQRAVSNDVWALQTTNIKPYGAENRCVHCTLDVAT